MNFWTGNDPPPLFGTLLKIYPFWLSNSSPNNKNKADHWTKFHNEIFVGHFFLCTLYKNCKNFYDLCMHQEDFGISADWTFLATSHGKGPYDGIGGCLKRTTAKASLSRTYKDQIIYPYQVYQFCRDNISGIKVLWCGEEHVNQLWKQKLEDRYGRARTVPGTQKYHFFPPIAGTTKVNAKLLSGDHVFNTHKTCSG